MRPKNTTHPRASPITVLVTHAEADLRAYVAQCLRTWQPPPMQILEAATAAEALALASDADLIIIDYLMQDPGGFTLHTMLAADAVFQKTPLHILADLDPDSFPAPTSPKVAVLTMPFYARKLLAYVEALLNETDTYSEPA